MKKENNSLALIVLSLALNKIYSNFRLYECSSSNENFYINFGCDEQVSFNDFKKIEKEMQKIISGAYKIEKQEGFYICNNLKFNNIKLDQKNNTKELKFFTITSIGGIDNLGSENNYRVYGNGFESQNEKDEFLRYQEELRSRDHRKIGQELKIFTFDDLAGQGLPILLPNGSYIKEKISSYLKSLFFKNDFEIVNTPVLGSKQLYITSGHWDLYKENNFPPIKIDNEEFMLRPMTCPHHILVYKSSNRTYKELPIKYFEDAKLHRYESSGGLIGLERVRAMELFDTHIFLKKDQIKETIAQLSTMIKEVFSKLNMKIDRIDLSLRSKEKDKFFNDDLMWEESQSMLREILKELNYDFYEIEGEAAFYGPKIDFQYKTILGKYITISTIQLDFLLPKRFELTYKDQNNEEQTPVLIHFGIIGTYERCISALLSQTKGNLPFWLQKTQIEIFPINNEFHLEYAKKVEQELLNNNLRVKLNASSERISKKILNAQKSKIRFQIIIGDEEVKTETLSIRRYGQEDSIKMSIKEFIELTKNE